MAVAYHIYFLQWSSPPLLPFLVKKVKHKTFSNDGKPVAVLDLYLDAYSSQVYYVTNANQVCALKVGGSAGQILKVETILSMTLYGSTALSVDGTDGHP